MTRRSLSPNPHDRALSGCCRSESSYLASSGRASEMWPRVGVVDDAGDTEAPSSLLSRERTAMLRGWSCRGEVARELPGVLDSDGRGDWLSLGVAGLGK